MAGFWWTEPQAEIPYERCHRILTWVLDLGEGRDRSRPRTCRRRGAAPVRQHRRQDPAGNTVVPMSTQVQRSVAIAGLDGVTQVTESLEGLLQGIEGRHGQRNACQAEAIAGPARPYGITSTTPWLASRISPSACSPVYQALAAARGQAARATDLFPRPRPRPAPQAGRSRRRS